MNVYLTAIHYIKIYGILEKDNIDKLLPHEWDFIFDVYAGYVWPAVNGHKKERIKSNGQLLSHTPSTPVATSQ